jgi:DnaJ-class molecular chaperone
VFERRGDDLVLRRKLSARTAREGGDITVQTLDRGTITVHLKRGEATGTHTHSTAEYHALVYGEFGTRCA